MRLQARVKGAKDSVYSALQARYDRLTSPVNAETSTNLDYLRSFTISEFEEIVGESIHYCLSKENNLYGRVKLYGKDIIIFITGEAKKELVNRRIITDEILIKSIKPVKYCIPTNSKPGLYVVLTARSGNTSCWMMTYYDPTVSVLDLSNVSASKLINIWAKDGIEAAIKAYEVGVLQEHLQDKKKNKVSFVNVDEIDISLEDLLSSMPDDDEKHGKKVD